MPSVLVLALLLLPPLLLLILLLLLLEGEACRTTNQGLMPLQQVL